LFSIFLLRAHESMELLCPTLPSNSPEMIRAVRLIQCFSTALSLSVQKSWIQEYNKSTLERIQMNRTVKPVVALRMLNKWSCHKDIYIWGRERVRLTQISAKSNRVFIFMKLTCDSFSQRIRGRNRQSLQASHGAP